jgi:hypothetical protein
MSMPVSEKPRMLNKPRTMGSVPHSHDVTASWVWGNVKLSFKRNTNPHVLLARQVRRRFLPNSHSNLTLSSQQGRTSDTNLKRPWVKWMKRNRQNEPEPARQHLGSGFRYVTFSDSRKNLYEITWSLCTFQTQQAVSGDGASDFCTISVGFESLLEHRLSWRLFFMVFKSLQVNAGSKVK